jgi:hypothetical protein
MTILEFPRARIAALLKPVETSAAWAILMPAPAGAHSALPGIMTSTLPLSSISIASGFCPGVCAAMPAAVKTMNNKVFT